jgi:ferric-dicitrate binding protein FerR (iron transport regulator)
MQDIWKSKPATNPQFSENSYQELLVRMHQLGLDADHFPQENIITRSGEKDVVNSKRKYFVSGIIITAIGIIFTSLFLFSKKSPQKDKPALAFTSEIVTKNGSKTNLVLPDGTNVFLNAGSKITYDKNYGNGSREINLVGEAYFDVVKNPAKPFIIHTPTINIRVLGTAFNVRCYPEEKNTETSLIRGSLEVSFKEGREKIILKPSEKLIVNNREISDSRAQVAEKSKVSSKHVFELSHVGLLPQDNTVIETSWVYNRLVFSSETFEEIASKMEKWYGVNIRFDNEELKNKKFTGVFEKETIYEALDAIQITTEFSYDEKDGTIILSK